MAGRSSDGGDAPPGHAARIYEIERKFPPGTAAIDGVAIVREKTVGFSDYTENHGPNSSYGSWFLEDGSKIFVTTAGTASSIVRSDGSKVREAAGTGIITNGTGRFKGIRDNFCWTVHTDPVPR